MQSDTPRRGAVRKGGKAAMSVTVANIVSYFSPAESLPEEFAHLPIRKRLPFCDFHDSEISPPRHRNGRVTFAVYLFSCKVHLIFEGAENFVRDGDFARALRRGKRHARKIIRAKFTGRYQKSCISTRTHI